MLCLWLVFFRYTCSQSFYSLFNFISDLSNLFYWFTFWIFYPPIHPVGNERGRTPVLFHTSHIDDLGRVSHHVFSQIFRSLLADIDSNLFHYLYCHWINFISWFCSITYWFIFLICLFVIF